MFGAVCSSCFMHVPRIKNQFRVNDDDNRDSIDWECVRLKAALIVYTLVHRTPELKELVFRPDGPINKPHNVLPSSYWVRV